MALPIAGQVGPQTLQDGASQGVRQGKSAEVIVSELHGRFFEQNYRGAVFSGGMTLTAISNATFTTGTLGATCTPIIGVWNPATSPVNIVVLQAILGITLTALQNTGGGPFVWATSTGNAALTLGSIPVNRRSMIQQGSFAKDMCGIALTGLTTTLLVRGAAELGGGNLYNIASLSTAAGFQTTQNPTVQNIDGSWIIPPGGILALLATTTPVAHSAASTVIWEEVPV
jgi:hypothetical protein